MAVSREPILKRCRYLGISPMVMGVSKQSNRNPGAGNRRKVSEYGMQLKEKQKLKFIYGVGEKQFYHLFEIASKMEGKAGDNLIACLESRLDSVVFRMGLALTRREARQLVTHGHFTVNGQRVDIPSYRVKEGDVVALSEGSRDSGSRTLLNRPQTVPFRYGWNRIRKTSPLRSFVWLSRKIWTMKLQHT